MSNKIILDPNFYITKDANNWILHYESDPFEKTIKGVVKTVRSTDTWYCATVTTALQRYVDRTLVFNDSVEELLIRVKELRKYLDIYTSPDLAFKLLEIE